MKFKKIYREPRVEWMKPRIKSMIWNIKKKKTFNQNSKKKKESKNKQTNKQTRIALVGVAPRIEH